MQKTENKYFIFDRPRSLSIKQIVKLLLNIIQRIWYKVLFLIIRPHRQQPTKYDVSICAIFRDEAAYLKEWIEFHIIAGIEHFYLYNNFSEDNYKEILQPYITRGIVTLKDWPVKQGQYSAYKDFFDNDAIESKWVALIDIDEFIVPDKMNTVKDFLNRFDNRPCVIAYWKVFGSSGIVSRNIKRFVTEDFTVCYRKYIDIGKVFFNTKYTYSLECDKGNSMHSMWALYKGIKLPPVNVFDKVCTHGYNPVNTDDMPIHINHYLIKSYEEYFEKKAKRGGGVHDVGMHSLDYYFRNEMNCQSSDYSAYKYLVKLKLAMIEGSSDKGRNE